MSAIFGICHLNGEPIGGEILHSMADVLSHHGPDGKSVWVDGEIGLGHCAMHSTAESLREALPLRLGTLTITADARIDNREELLRLLVPEAAKEVTITDSELILRAFRKWRESCPEHLLGDFVFAIWDDSNKSLFCARDHMGVRPLYYHYQPGRRLIFASEIKAILSTPDVQQQLDEEKLADYMLDSFENQSRTFYRGINRLPSASSLALGRNGAKLTTYWTLDPEREIRLKSDAEYSEQFRAHFDESVRCRLRSAFPVGAMLSGGLDSSSIACAAYELHDPAHSGPLHTFSIIFDRVSQSDERPHIDRVLSGKSVTPHFVNGDNLTPFDDLDKVLKLQDEPFCAPNMALTRGVWRSAREHGVKVLLDGLFGDNVVSHGIEYLNELAQKWRLVRLGQELRQLIDRSGRDVKLGDPLLDYWVREGIKPHVPRAILRAWRKHRGYASNPTEYQLSLFQPSFAERVGLQERLTNAYVERQRLKKARQAHFEALTCGLIQSALEIYSHGCAEFGVETRFPFADVRLVEFCLAMPGNQKVAQGYTRTILRRAMAGSLPEATRWRSDKGDLGWSFASGFTTQRALVESTIQASRHFLGDFLDLSHIDKILSKAWNRSPSDENLSLLFSLVVLSVWYSSTQPRNN